MKVNLQEDMELLQGIRLNDAGAFSQLFDTYWQLLYDSVISTFLFTSVSC